MLHARFGILWVIRKKRLIWCFFINGLPFATFELKNHWTGQNAQSSWSKSIQIQERHYPTFVEFRSLFGAFHCGYRRSLYDYQAQTVAVPSFLPFNLGHNFGKGNPPNPFGHKNFVFCGMKFSPVKALPISFNTLSVLMAKTPIHSVRKPCTFRVITKWTWFRKLIADASTKGVGQTYLIQHSAGSGKSNSITWAAFQLIENLSGK